MAVEGQSSAKGSPFYLGGLVTIAKAKIAVVPEKIQHDQKRQRVTENRPQKKGFID